MTPQYWNIEDEEILAFGCNEHGLAINGNLTQTNAITSATRVVPNSYKFTGDSRMFKIPGHTYNGPQDNWGTFKPHVIINKDRIYNGKLALENRWLYSYNGEVYQVFYNIYSTPNNFSNATVSLTIRRFGDFTDLDTNTFYHYTFDIPNVNIQPSVYNKYSFYLEDSNLDGGIAILASAWDGALATGSSPNTFDNNNRCPVAFYKIELNGTNQPTVTHIVQTTTYGSADYELSTNAFENSLIAMTMVNSNPKKRLVVQNRIKKVLGLSIDKNDNTIHEYYLLGEYIDCIFNFYEQGTNPQVEHTYVADRGYVRFYRDTSMIKEYTYTRDFYRNVGINYSVLGLPKDTLGNAVYDNFTSDTSSGNVTNYIYRINQIHNGLYFGSTSINNSSTTTYENIILIQRFNNACFGIKEVINVEHERDNIDVALVRPIPTGTYMESKYYTIVTPTTGQVYLDDIYDFGGNILRSKGLQDADSLYCSVNPENGEFSGLYNVPVCYV